jgi:MoaA/NifB/PqqE/SkfB family radical SAM enzyme
VKPAHYPLSVLQNRLGRVPRPSWCTYLVCNRCNARCTMCDSWRIPRGVELTPEEVGQVFAKLGSLDVVRLSGGEPFLRADLLELAEAVLRESNPLVLHITSNGSFPERIARFARSFSQPRRLRFMISFDGLPAVHDQNRGKVVSFERALESVKELVALRSSGVRVSANHTIISRASLADHAGLKARLAELEVDTQWVLAYSESSMYVRERRGRRADDLVVASGYPLHPALDPADSLEFALGELEHTATLDDPLLRVGKRYYVEGLVARLRGDEQPAPQPRCVALRSHIRLLPDGGVPVCQFNTEQVGNLLHQSLDELWHGTAGKSARAWVDRCTGCWAECEVMPNALYSGDLVQQALRSRLRGARSS